MSLLGGLRVQRFETPCLDCQLKTKQDRNEIGILDPEALSTTGESWPVIPCAAICSDLTVLTWVGGTSPPLPS